MSFWKAGGCLNTQASSEIVKILIKMLKFIYFHTNGFTKKRFSSCSFNELHYKIESQSPGWRGRSFYFFEPPNELSSSISKSRKLRLEDSDLLPTRGYKHMLKHPEMGFSTTFAKLSPKISNFTDSVITEKHLHIAQCVTHTTSTQLLIPP